MSPENKSNLDEIRKKAEKIARKKPLVLPVEKAEEYQTLIHELHVHQIELEIQNEELRSTQQNLEFTRNQYADLFENAPVGYLILDRSGFMQRINQTFAEMVGKDLAQLIRRPFADYLTQTARHIFLSQYKAFFSRPDNKSMDLEIVREGADNVTIALYGCRECCLTNFNGDVSNHDHIRIVAIDITEQRKVENELAATHDELRLRHQIAEVMLKSTDKGMYKEVLKILLKHLDSGYGYFGYIDEEGNLCHRPMTRGNISGNVQIDNRTTIERSDWIGVWGKSLLEKQTIIKNTNLKLPGRQNIISNVLAVPIVNRDQLVGQIVLAERQGDYIEDDAKRLKSVAAWIAPVLSARLDRDRQQAQRIKAENNLLQAQRMESIGVLAGGVAHDFNNLLTPIIGYTDMMIESKNKNHPDTQVLREISSAALRAKDLINQLLAYSRKQMLQVKPTDINGVINSVVRMINRLIREDITVEYELQKDVGIIKADAGQIDQILMNLAINAQDALPNGGKILIKTSRDYFPKPKIQYPFEIIPGNYTVLTFKDNGTGIPEDALPFIYEPFFTTKDVGKGTGMGLATCFGIVKQHGGHIWAESSPEKGTEFTILFPSVTVFKHNSSKDEDNVLRKMICSKGETVIVVEDDPAVRRMAVTALKHLGYKVFEAESPDNCMEIISTQNITVDLLVTDVVMPGGNGAELLLKLRTFMNGLRCLFMSGYSVDVVSDQGLMEMGADFISKPFTINEFSIKVREVLDG